MPIEKGEDWGVPGQLPSDARVVTSDAALGALLHSDQTAPIVAGVVVGDLARTLGVRQPYDRSAPKQLLPVDVLRIELDEEREHWAVAHAVLGRLHRQRHVIAIMNAAFVGDRNVAPRAHPGDGKADVVTLGLGLADRLKARGRMVTGTHVPHPNISVRRVASLAIEQERPCVVRIDGVTVGRASKISFTLVPDMLIVAV